MKIENLLFKRIELWIVFILVIAGIVSAVLFGGVVRHYCLGGSHLGNLGPIVEAVAAFPITVKKVIFGSNKKELAAKQQRFSGQSGFQFNFVPGSRPDLGYVLVNRYDRDLGFSVAELWDINSQYKVHTWNFAGVDSIWKESNLGSGLIIFSVDAAANRFRNTHALLTENGDLFTATFGTPLIKADACSVLTLFQDKSIYHHSLERDHNSNLWVPKRIEPKIVDIGSKGFIDDGIAQISPSGEVLFEKSVIQLLDENGLGYLIYGNGLGNSDPIHLNDIQPVLADGNFWKQGDVFLSLRHQSMIVLYRPSTNKVIWHQQGPWMHQHDVDILSDHEISIFNNNAARSGDSEWTVRGVNNVLIYNFASKAIQSPWQAGFEKHDLRTKTEGRGDIVGKEVFVEETNYGRMIQFSPNGSVSWQFINRALDGKVYLLNWSRLIPRELGDSVRSIVAKKSCL